MRCHQRRLIAARSATDDHHCRHPPIIAADAEGFDPARTLLVDDSRVVLDSARRYGIAQLVSVKRPDSTRRDNDTGDYPAIDDFSQLMPGVASPRREAAHG